MNFIIGITIVFLAVMFGFIGSGSNVAILYQPYEYVLILGTALGSVIIATPTPIMQDVKRDLYNFLYDKPYTKKDYLELLAFLFNFFKLIQKSSARVVEDHIDNHYNSTLFNRFPVVIQKTTARKFVCDYVRLISLGIDKPHELVFAMDNEIHEQNSHNNEVSSVLYRLGDALPAIGIIAAICGIINAFGYLSADPYQLGGKIGGALMGTLIGIFLSYCVVSPIAMCINKNHYFEIKSLEIIKASLLSFTKNQPPSLAIEFARKIVPENLRPSFDELQTYIERNTMSIDAMKIRRRNV